ncbi:uncharacterized protein LOC141716652 [Apium graveolens]|uniref:uncharacterized protein LOC141716652 n=1 Tax=Apium graveolens TaxID=4045 RepID=UPI003D79A903
MQTKQQQKRWMLKLRAKANKLKLEGKRLFSGCKFSMFCIKVFKKKSAAIKLKTETPVSVVPKSKSLKYKIFKILKKLGIKRTKNKDAGAEINARAERLSDKNVHENSRAGSAQGLRSQLQPNPVGNNGQGVRENDVTEKMIGGLIIMSHYFLMVNKYVGSNKPNHLLIFVISMAMGYFTITCMRSIDQIEDFISGLISRACSCYVLL